MKAASFAAYREDLLLKLAGQKRLSLSFEFFPPKEPSQFAAVKETAEKFRAFSPSFFSVTYGAGGGTRDNTFALATEIQRQTGVPVAAHITCVGQPADDLRALARQYKQAGIRRYVALRGDMPDFGAAFVPHPQGFTHSAQLVAALKEEDPGCDISVAAFPETHPEAASPESDIGYLQEKLAAGAGRAVMQYCFDTVTILRFIERCRAAGITAPIAPGIMPVRDFAGVKRFSARCGASVPEAMKYIFAEGKSKEALHRAAFFLALEQCLILAESGLVEHLHLYCMNRYAIAGEVCEMLTG